MKKVISLIVLAIMVMLPMKVNASMAFEFVKVADVNSAQQIVTYSVKDIGYGRHTITFRVKDSNCKEDLSTTNNFVEKTYYFAIDDEAPNLTVKNANNQYVGDSFIISGTVTDANGIDKIEISILSL